MLAHLFGQRRTWSDVPNVLARVRPARGCGLVRVMDTCREIVDVVARRLIPSATDLVPDGAVCSSVGLLHKAAALLVWLLSMSPSLAASYVLSVSARQLCGPSESAGEASTVFRLLRWWQEVQVAALVDCAAVDCNHKVRVRADDFLMRSLVADFVSLQNAKGLPVPTEMVIQTYLRLWLHRVCPPRLQDRLVKLTYHYNTRRRFAVNFRAEWMLQHSTIQVARDLGHAEIGKRVSYASSIELRLGVVSVGP